MGLSDVLNGMRNGPRGGASTEHEQPLWRHVTHHYGAASLTRIQGFEG